MKKTFITKSEGETIKVAAAFTKTLKGGDIILLEGDLGAGKTVFVRGIAKALGVRERVQSPTFILMRIHNIESKKKTKGDTIFSRPRRNGITQKKLDSHNLNRHIFHFVHVDAYRIQNADDLKDIGIEEYLGAKDAITVIEWGEKARPLCRGKKCKRVKFKFVDETTRKIKFEF